MSFRFRNLEQLGRNLSVSIPTDDAGLLGRECPIESCELFFKIKPGSGLSGPDLTCTCPYCGHTASPKQFYTKAQIEYAKSVAFQKISDAFGRDLKQLETRPRRGAGFGLGVTVREGRRPPIAYYVEEALETHLTCSGCTLEYAVYGLFAYCPDCARHNSADVLRGNLELVRRQLQLALAQEDPALRRHLMEDALENCVSAFDGFGREALRAAYPGRSEMCSVSFQNLDRAAERLLRLGGINMRLSLPTDTWTDLRRSFMKRHLLAHRAGVVDDHYLAEANDPEAVKGRRVAIDASEVEEASAALVSLGEWLTFNAPAASGQ